jgi:hypothetical protein
MSTGIFILFPVLFSHRLINSFIVFFEGIKARGLWDCSFDRLSRFQIP